MKDTIKIIIALAFILGSYLLGNHQEDEKYQSKIDELDKIIQIEKKNNSNLQDSIVNLKHVIESFKTTPVRKNRSPRH